MNVFYIDDILFGKLQNGGKVRVNVEGGNLKIECFSLEELQKPRSIQARKTHALPGKS